MPIIVETGHEPVAASPALRGSPESEALLTVREVAELLRVPISWVYERTRRRGTDRLPHLKIGKYVRFRIADVNAYLERFTRG